MHLTKPLIINTKLVYMLMILGSIGCTTVLALTYPDYMDEFFGLSVPQCCNIDIVMVTSFVG